MSFVLFQKLVNYSTLMDFFVTAIFKTVLELVIQDISFHAKNAIF